jgi:hypothetical protein
MVHPEWALSEQEAMDTARHRTLAGRLATLQWDRYAEFRVPLRYVPGDAAALVKNWWAEGANIAFTLDTSHDRSTVVCAISNARLPLAERAGPDGDRWSGILQLSARTAGGRCGQPFILDDSVSGLLDQSFLTLVE